MIWSQIEKEAIPGCDVTVPVRKQSGWSFVHRKLVSSVWESISADGCKICRGVLSCILKFSPLYPNFTSSVTNSPFAIPRLNLISLLLNKRFVDSMSVSPWRSILFLKKFEPVCPADKHERKIDNHRNDLISIYEIVCELSPPKLIDCHSYIPTSTSSSEYTFRKFLIRNRRIQSMIFRSNRQTATRGCEGITSGKTINYKPYYRYEHTLIHTRGKL